jgi:hypothetical protein
VFGPFTKLAGRTCFGTVVRADSVGKCQGRTIETLAWYKLRNTPLPADKGDTGTGASLMVVLMEPVVLFPSGAGPDCRV